MYFETWKKQGNNPIFEIFPAQNTNPLAQDDEQHQQPSS